MRSCVCLKKKDPAVLFVIVLSSSVEELFNVTGVPGLWHLFCFSELRFVFLGFISPHRTALFSKCFSAGRIHPRSDTKCKATGKAAGSRWWL